MAGCGEKAEQIATKPEQVVNRAALRLMENIPKTVGYVTTANIRTTKAKFFHRWEMHITDFDYDITRTESVVKPFQLTIRAKGFCRFLAELEENTPRLRFYDLKSAKKASVPVDFNWEFSASHYLLLNTVDWGPTSFRKPSLDVNEFNVKVDKGIIVPLAEYEWNINENAWSPKGVKKKLLWPFDNIIIPAENLVEEYIPDPATQQPWDDYWESNFGRKKPSIAKP